MKVENFTLEKLIPYSSNNRVHNDLQISRIAESISEFGFNQPIVIDEDNIILVGHGRYEAAKKLKLKEVPVLKVLGLDETKKRAYRILDNKLQNDSTWNFENLESEIEFLKDQDFDIEAWGLDSLFEEENSKGSDNKDEPSLKGVLFDRFLVPPFSVLDSRQGYWQDRKRLWKHKNIDNGEGRELSLTYNIGETGGGGFHDKVRAVGATTSIFDPVLCELVYRWFSPSRALILDPFAGGSTRGMVASLLKRDYIGIDIRAEQVESNRVKAIDLDPSEYPTPIYHIGDSQDIGSICEGVEADLVFSCPPYFDLESYSENPADLSNMKHQDFTQAYRKIILEACKKLKNNRFACFVIGDVRNTKGGSGEYLNFPGITIQAFLDAGLKLYNEAILINAVGSVSIRAGRCFSSGRKLGKMHQNVLVFIKGDPKIATKDCGEVEVALPEDMEEESEMDL